MNGKTICKKRALKNKDGNSIERELTTKIPLGAFAWEQTEESHSDFFTANKAINWLGEYNDSKPFFLEIGSPGPHPPYDPTTLF